MTESLSAAAPPAASAPPAPIPLPDNPADAPPRTSRRVLAIVGDATLRRFLTEALGHAGHAVEATGDVGAGLATAVAAPPAVILLDLDQAALGCASFAAWYRGQPGPRVPLVLLSAQGPAATAAAAEALGAYGFLQLPFDLDALWTLVARATSAAASEPVDPVEAPPAAPPGLPSKRRREAVGERQRRRLLELLARDVAAIGPAADRLREELRALAERKAAGRLSQDEAARFTVLRRELEALRLRLRECAAEYERLRRRDDRGR
jgi:CheY-like chemotaxis protein